MDARNVKVIKILSCHLKKNIFSHFFQILVHKSSPFSSGNFIPTLILQTAPLLDSIAAARPAHFNSSSPLNGSHDGWRHPSNRRQRRQRSPQWTKPDNESTSDYAQQECECSSTRNPASVRSALHQTIKKSQQISTGRGTHSEVFRATTSKGMVAIKLIDQRAGGDYIRRFLERELRILIQLKHPRVVNVFAVSQTRLFFRKPLKVSD